MYALRKYSFVSLEVFIFNGKSLVIFVECRFAKEDFVFGSFDCVCVYMFVEIVNVVNFK